VCSSDLENPIKTPVVEGGITENLDQGAKEVSFTNNGEADVFLRVAFAQSWVAHDGTVLPNNIVDASGQALPVAVPSLSLDGNWEGGEDGWYYYKRVLPGSASGMQDRSTEKLVRGVDFMDLTGIEDQRYKNAEYKFHFTMEIVQSSDDWNVSRKAVQRLFDRDISVTPDNWDGDKYGCSINWNVDPGKN